MVDLALLQSVSYIAGALGVCVAAIYYVMTLRISQRNQEVSLKTQELALKSQQQAAETRQAQLFMQVFNRFHDQEFWRIYGTLMSVEYKSYDDWNRDRSDPTLFSMRLSVGAYFEGVGVLVRRGLLPPRAGLSRNCFRDGYKWF